MSRRLLAVFLVAAVCLVARVPAPAHALTLNVTTTTDCNTLGCGSLRDAINQANGSAGPDTINISITGTLTLTSALPPIFSETTINGPGQASFTIAAGCAGCSGLRFFASGAVADLTISGAQTDGITVSPIVPPTTLTVRNVTVANAGSGGGIAGGVVIPAGVTATLTNVTVTGSQGFAGPLSVTGTAIVEDSTISNSTEGVAVNAGGSLTMRRSSVIGITAGGGISSEGTLTIENSLIAGNNEALAGGGLQVTGGMAVVRNTTIANNSAGSFGGGVVSSVSSLTMVNVTLAGNQAPEGSGIRTFGGGVVNLQNTLIANSAGTNCSGPVTSQGNNLASDATCNLTAPGDLQNTPPGFATGALASNGGPTQTVALAQTSAAVDAGSNAAATCAAGAFDQRGAGFPRTTDGNGDGAATCDIGAFELQGGSADVAVTKTTSTTSVVQGASVTYTITLRNNGPLPASNVVATDVLPAGLTFSSLSPTSGAGITTTTPAAGSGGTVTIGVASLASGASQVFTLVAQVSATAPAGIANTVSITAATVDSNAANNSATATIGTVAPTVVPTPWVPPVIPQQMQNPGAIAAVAGRPPATQRPGVAAVAPITAMPVITPPSTGDAGMASS